MYEHAPEKIEENPAETGSEKESTQTLEDILYDVVHELDSASEGGAVVIDGEVFSWEGRSKKELWEMRDRVFDALCLQYPDLGDYWGGKEGAEKGSGETVAALHKPAPFHVRRRIIDILREEFRKNPPLQKY